MSARTSRRTFVFPTTIPVPKLSPRAGVTGVKRTAERKQATSKRDNWDSLVAKRSVRVQRTHPHSGTPVACEAWRGQQAGRHRVVRGPCQLAELEALRFVAQVTSIPVPKIHRTYIYHGKFFIELEYIKGQDLESAWRQDLSADQKKAVIDELGGFVSQLRYGCSRMGALLRRGGGAGFGTGRCGYKSR
ncbi:hypothetical protein GQ44DRAFT_718640 [Phaeosphaeriaceae sp. PMI808]|nr:hypothetical protein GQ44DRAFT_718640 [Phaeosphaeriaceae sp. PMI808]